MDAIDKAGYKGKVGIAMDVASSGSTRTVNTTWTLKPRIRPI